MSDRGARAGWVRWGVAGLMMVVVLVVDQVVKSLVREHITFDETISIVPGVDIVHTTNRGIAFSLFPGHPRIVATVTAVALCLIAVALVRFGRRSTAVLIGGGMLVGGAIGNLIDRLRHDGVTDFIAVTSHWPPFNVADIGIVCGAILAAIGLMGERAD